VATNRAFVLPILDEGPSLAVEWCHLYGSDDDLNISMHEIEL
jgi:hypothetical protein